uniref:K+ efflux antiporter 2ic-like isoform X1 n=1 Tax=Rhizophora mucronata TaxID=61149 RepID=A0A2P2LJ74_RHIMU
MLIMASIWRRLGPQQLYLRHWNQVYNWQQLFLHRLNCPHQRLQQLSMNLGLDTCLNLLSYVKLLEIHLGMDFLESRADPRLSPLTLQMITKLQKEH